MSYTDGVTEYASIFTMTTAQADGFAVCPPSEFTAVPVTNIAYSQGSVAGASGTTISVESLANTTTNATGKLHLDLSDLASRTTAGKGASVTSITLYYTLLTAVLTGPPTVTAVTQTFGAAGAAAVTPTANAAAGGAVTSVPASPPVAVPTLGQFYTATFTFATPIALNAAMARSYIEIGVPMTATGTFQLAGATVNFTNSPL